MHTVMHNIGHASIVTCLHRPDPSVPEHRYVDLTCITITVNKQLARMVIGVTNRMGSNYKQYTTYTY